MPDKDKSLHGRKGGMIESPIKGTVDSLAKVDECLSDLYTRAIEEEAAAPTVKTVLFNLIVYAATDEQARDAVDYVTEVLAEHPCRAIIAEVVPGSSPQAAASVSVMCGITERGDRRLCGEIIQLHAAPGAALIGSVMPLLVPDVPVFLWILGDLPHETEEFRDLVRAASHIIIDSRSFDDLHRGFRLARRFGEADGSDRITLDLSWISIQPWREFTAQHFDAPAMRPYLNEINRVTIRYARDTIADYPASAPLLLASWFIERTGMEIAQAFRTRDAGFRIEAKQNDRPAEIRLIPEASGFGAGMLVSVVVECGSGERSAKFTTQGVSETELSLTEECVGVCLPPKNLELPAQDPAALACEALDYYRRDRIFESALDVALATLDRFEMTGEKTLHLRL